MESLLLWICGLVSISLTGAHELDVFPENFEVVKDPNIPVTLKCNTETGNFTWKLNGQVIENQHNPTLNFPEIDNSDYGNYSCWKEEKMISSTYLLREAKEVGNFDSFISCRAKSYDCNFTCKRTNNEYTLVRLGLGRDCREGGESCHWVSVKSSQQVQDEEFELSHTLSPYAEESTMLELTVQAIKDFLFFRSEKNFFLRDIVQPESPQIVKCEKVDQRLNVTIHPPATWSTPHSFFSLQHEIEYELKDDGKIESSLSTLIPESITRLRVRCRDSVVVSAWSQWTSWTNVTC